MLWDSPSELLRSQGQAHSGPVLWGAAPLPWAEEVRRVRCQPCGRVKPEQVPWLASIPFDTKPFAWYMGRRGRKTDVTRTWQDHSSWPGRR
jgi:hypothetical protein